MAEKRMQEETRREEENLKERAMQQIAAKENAKQAHDKHRKHFVNTLDALYKQKVNENISAHFTHDVSLR